MKSSLQGHECTLMLNKAYEVLMRDDLRKEYDSSIGRISVGVERVDYGSIWKGPIRPQALFVDENACIGNMTNRQLTCLFQLVDVSAYRI